MPRLVVLHGPAACGKYTIASALAALTGDALFHNHLTVDLLRALFPFGSPEFVRFREAIWLSVMGDLARSGRNVLFTFHPEASVAPDFPARLEARLRALGGSVRYVRIVCEEPEIRRRLGSASRGGAKLKEVALHDRLKAEGAFEYPDLPAGLTVDSAAISASENARRIADWLAVHGG